MFCVWKTSSKHLKYLRDLNGVNVLKKMLVVIITAKDKGWEYAFKMIIWNSCGLRYEVPNTHVYVSSPTC